MIILPLSLSPSLPPSSAPVPTLASSAAHTTTIIRAGALKTMIAESELERRVPLPHLASGEAGEIESEGCVCEGSRTRARWGDRKPLVASRCPL
jgi:hypothetical protein